MEAHESDSKPTASGPSAAKVRAQPATAIVRTIKLKRHKSKGSHWLCLAALIQLFIRATKSTNLSRKDVDCEEKDAKCPPKCQRSTRKHTTNWGENTRRKESRQNDHGELQKSF